MVVAFAEKRKKKIEVWEWGVRILFWTFDVYEDYWTSM